MIESLDCVGKRLERVHESALRGGRFCGILGRTWGCCWTSPAPWTSDMLRLSLPLPGKARRQAGSVTRGFGYISFRVSQGRSSEADEVVSGEVVVDAESCCEERRLDVGGGEGSPAGLGLGKARTPPLGRLRLRRRVSLFFDGRLIGNKRRIFAARHRRRWAADR